MILLTSPWSLCKELIFVVLTLLFQELCSSPSHAFSQIICHIPTDGSPFFHNQYLGFVRIWGVCLFIHLLRIDHKISVGLRSGEFLGKTVSESTPHTQTVSGCFTVGMTQDSWWRSPFLLQTLHFLGIKLIFMAMRDFAINCNPCDHSGVYAHCLYKNWGSRLCEK